MNTNIHFKLFSLDIKVKTSPENRAIEFQHQEVENGGQPYQWLSRIHVDCKGKVSLVRGWHRRKVGKRLAHRRLAS